MLDCKIPPPLLVLVIGGVMWGVARFVPAVGVDMSWRVGLAASLGCVALGIAVPAFSAFGKANTTIDPIHLDRASSLVTGGIFSQTRNPMYVALTMVLLAWCIYLAVPWAVVGPVVFVVYITRFQILPEERVMREKFGAAYIAYQASVRRWL